MNSSSSISFFQYWGKALPKATDGPQYHLLAYHSLDVAATGQIYLQRLHKLRRTLADYLGLNEDTFVAWIAFFLAIHDLGKFAISFQNQRADLLQQLQHRSNNKPYSVRHDSLGFLFWEQCLLQLLAQENWLKINVNESANRRYLKGLTYWARAVTGHHGQPPQRRPNNVELTLNAYFSDQDQQAAIAFCQAMHKLLLPSLSVNEIVSIQEFNETSKKASWWLAGISVLADWIGSNADAGYFPYKSDIIPLDEYWRSAQSNAVAAMDKVGVLPVPIARNRSLAELFPAIERYAPTPLQQRVATLPLGDKPQLFILEDVTGAGKTEAAILLAHRLMSAGLGQGIYMGLPTMATSNAMYKRMAAVYKHLFADNTEPSIILAHSARHLSARFRKAVLAASRMQDLDYADDEQSATARCTAWLADGRKKSLLATLGVGTIDQALLGILYSKHQSLRLLGLFDKILIVDEVHACDAYMHTLLKELLKFHSFMGGSAILLSATLPQRTRQELVDAFCEGCGRSMPELTDEHYPLLTHIGGPDRIEHPLDTRLEVKRRVQIGWVSSVEEVEKTVLKAVAAGRCVCWIRNTVGDALDAYDALADKIRTDHLTLFHARFAMGDRLTIEQRVVRQFGKDSKAEDRAGRVVIATQVVEQSLDLDFDVMISDLAPIDLLIQRAGRLCRHTRDEQGNPIDGPDQRGAPCLFVHGPEPLENAIQDWFSAAFPGAAAVYLDHGQLWLTARLLSQQGAFSMPEDARKLIEGVYGAEAETFMPENLLAIHYNVEGEDMANRSQGRMNSLNLEGGYQIEGLNWWEDAVTPTRLGDPTITVRLARWDGHTLTPWSPGEYAWDLSQLQVRQSRISKTVDPVDPALKAAVVQLLETLPDKGKWSVLLPLAQETDGEWTGTALDGRGNTVRVLYDARRGLRLEK